MRNRKTVLLAASTFLMSITPLVAFRSGHIYHEIIAGAATLVFLFAAQELNRSVLKESVAKRGKAYRDFIETLGVFTVIVAGLTVEVVPFQLGLAMLGILGVTKVYSMELSDRFRKSFDFRLGEKIWVGMTATMYLLAHSNTYFLFYGYILLTAVIIYDLAGLFTDLRDMDRV